MKPCCANLENRAEGPGPRGMDGLGEPPPEVTITHCTVCECRHLEADLEPGHFGLKGAAL